ncbi:MAG: ComEC/Rec2 family competence protein [Caulobacteraceae bacterium]
MGPPRRRAARGGPWGRAAALITGKRALPSLAGLLAGLAREAADQLDRVLLWTPVAFGLGAAAYLGLKVEPALWLAAVLAAVLCAVALATRFLTVNRVAIAVTGLTAVAAGGFLIAKLHSVAVAAPIVPPHLGVVSVEGWVVDIANPSERGERLLIAPVDIAHLAPADTPTRVRVIIPSLGPEDAPAPGTAIRVSTLLDPPPGPASPGAYDFARDAWFEGIGGVGLAMRAPVAVQLAPPPWRLRLEMAVNALRWKVARRLAADIGAAMGPNDGGAAGLAVAVTTSHQDWLAPAHRDDLRASGLAHMLAIAGLHTAALSGFAFFAFRLAIAAWPWLALRVPGKKVAALAALVVVGAYLVLSGAHPPARRAAITASVAFFAILVDRRAVSLHSLSVAALIILLTEPDVVLAPGFEMSFCATASLVALAEIWRRAPVPVSLAWPLAFLQKARDWTIAMLAVSFVAGAATGPFAIQHFNRMANYGVFANLTADFLATALLMPALALSLLAEAAGLAHPLAAPIFWLAGWAARGVIFLGHVFAVAPGAATTLPSAPQVALAISYLGIVFACLWRGNLRWIGLPMAMAVALWPRPPAPVAWIAADGDDAAIVAAGQEVALKPGARQYGTQLWAQRRGFALPADPAAAEALQRRHFDCDRKGCAPIGAARPALAAWWGKRPPKADQADRLCAGADIVIYRAEGPAPAACEGAIVLNRADFAKGGAAEVFAAPAAWRIAWSQPLRGERPWTTGGGD